MEHWTRKKNNYLCVEHASVKREMNVIFRRIFKNVWTWAVHNYIRPLMTEVEGVFVAVASLDGRGVGSEMFAMASILSCLL
jgi:hypothetical protein